MLYFSVIKNIPWYATPSQNNFDPNLPPQKSPTPLKLAESRFLAELRRFRAKTFLFSRKKLTFPQKLDCFSK